MMEGSREIAKNIQESLDEDPIATEGQEPLNPDDFSGLDAETVAGLKEDVDSMLVERPESAEASVDNEAEAAVELNLQEAEQPKASAVSAMVDNFAKQIEAQYQIDPEAANSKALELKNALIKEAYANKIEPGEALEALATEMEKSSAALKEALTSMSERPEGEANPVRTAQANMESFSRKLRAELEGGDEIAMAKKGAEQTIQAMTKSGQTDEETAKAALDSMNQFEKAAESKDDNEPLDFDDGEIDDMFAGVG